MSPVSQIELGKLVTVMTAEENPLVKADLVAKYVKALDEQDKAGVPCAHLYVNAYSEYNKVIRDLNDEDTTLITFFKKRADYCARKAGIRS